MHRMRPLLCFIAPGVGLAPVDLVSGASRLSRLVSPRTSVHSSHISQYRSQPYARANKTFPIPKKGSRATVSSKQPNDKSKSPPPCQFPPGESRLAQYFHTLLNHPITEIMSAFLVMGTCLVFALQTLNFTGLAERLLWGYERGVSSLFAVEYFLRWYSVGLKPQFLLTRCMIIDFCAVLLPLAFSAASYPNQDQFGGLFFRSLRFARVFQLQRVMEEEEMRNIFGDVPESRARIANVVLTVFTILYISAGLFHVRFLIRFPFIPSLLFPLLFFLYVS